MNRGLDYCMTSGQSSDRSLKRTVTGALVLVVVIIFLLHVGFGTTLNLSPIEVLRLIMAGPHADRPHTPVIWAFRLPRACGAALVGALLGGAGSAFQALFKNPLSEPYTVGTASGAALGGVIAIIIGLDGWAGRLGVTGFAFVGGLGSLLFVMALARRRGVIEVNTLLLAGVMVGSLLSAFLSLALYLAGKDTNLILRWLLGSVDPMYWSRVWMMLAVLVVAGGLLLRQSKALNALAVGESAAQRLGVDVPRLRLLILYGGAAMTAAAVGSAGIIGFVGLAAPHVARRLVGVDWRASLPASFLVGSAMLLLADLLTQRLIGGGLPVGIVTALLGAPFLLVLLGRRG